MKRSVKRLSEKQLGTTPASGKKALLAGCSEKGELLSPPTESLLGDELNAVKSYDLLAIFYIFKGARVLKVDRLFFEM